MTNQNLTKPGLIVLFGSGETSPTGRKIFDKVFQKLPDSPRIALLETPAGFELNSHQVIKRVADFFSHHLQNYSPIVEIVPARKRDTGFSPDDPNIVTPLLEADMIFMGPGSPTYATRQLKESLAWYYLRASHRHGAILALASAATIAFSAYALPVYEIYKVGEDLHWNEGLNFFDYFGLKIVFIPHWNNQEGGPELDTSRCFMGKNRFISLLDMLPEATTVIGLDEKTALLMDLSKGECLVSGLGKVTLVNTGYQHFKYTANYNDQLYPDADSYFSNMIEQRGGFIHQFTNRQAFPIDEIGPFKQNWSEDDLPGFIIQKANEVKIKSKQRILSSPPEEVLQLIQARDQARYKRDWSSADDIRRQIEALGWEVIDTMTGPVCKKLPRQ